MKLVPRDYQKGTLNFIGDFIFKKGNKQILVSSPTGTGKGIVQLFLLNLLSTTRVHLITTRVSIVRNYLKALGHNTSNLSEAQMRKEAEKKGIYTYIRYANLLTSGELEAPETLIIDEAHHFIDDNISIDEIKIYAGDINYIGFTATPFRSSARETKKLLEFWGSPYISITIREAFEQGFWKLPEIKTIGLINDDLIKVQNGKFVVSSINKYMSEDILERLADIVRENYKGLPSILEVASRKVAKMMVEKLQDLKPSLIISETSDSDRRVALDKLEKGGLLIEVAIFSEGFDIPACSLFIDAKPKMSPVNFLQSFGRLTRPHENEKTYICLNWNIFRHSYLLEDIIPTSAILEAQEAFGVPYKKPGLRLGLEKFNKKKALYYTRSDGVTGVFYNLQSIEGTKQTDYCIIVHPDKIEPTVAVRKVDIAFSEELNEYGQQKRIRTYGKWEKAPMPDTKFEGFSTNAWKDKITDKMLNFWNRSAFKVGLEPSIIPESGREFQIMPVLRDIGGF